MEFKNIDALNITECCEQLCIKREDLPEALQDLIVLSERDKLLLERLQSLLNEDKSAIESCRTIEQYERYLSTWVDGLNHGYARARISQLKSDAEEHAFYDSNKASISGCEAYLRKYPKGKFVIDAQSTLAQKKMARKTRNIILLVLLLIAAGIFAYSHYVPVSYVYVDDNAELNNLGSEISLDISTDAISSTISATSSEDWVHCRVSGKNLYISALENPNKERCATITITAHSSFFGDELSENKSTKITITQVTGHATRLSLSKNEENLSYTAVTSIISINTDGICTISKSPASWVIASISGPNLFLQCSENPDVVRDTYLTIASGTKSQNLKITQAGKKALFLEPSQSNISFPYTGGTKTITVSTDGLWEIGAEPEKWVELSRSNNIITINVDKYNGERKRDDYFTIRSGNIEKRIYVTQEPDIIPRAIINKVWAVHNQPRGVFPYNYNAMVIHVGLDVINMTGKEIRICAFFYDKNGNKMNAIDNRYRTRDGQTTVQSTSIASYRNSHWEDYPLEIPYFAISKGNNKFYIEIQDENGKCIGVSDYVYFSRDY